MRGNEEDNAEEEEDEEEEEAPPQGPRICAATALHDALGLVGVHLSREEIVKKAKVKDGVPRSVMDAAVMLSQKNVLRVQVRSAPDTFSQQARANPGEDVASWKHILAEDNVTGFPTEFIVWDANLLPHRFAACAYIEARQLQCGSWHFEAAKKKRLARETVAIIYERAAAPPSQEELLPADGTLPLRPAERGPYKTCSPELRRVGCGPEDHEPAQKRPREEGQETQDAQQGDETDGQETRETQQTQDTERGDESTQSFAEERDHRRSESQKCIEARRLRNNYLPDNRQEMNIDFVQEEELTPDETIDRLVELNVSDGQVIAGYSRTDDGEWRLFRAEIVSLGDNSYWVRRCGSDVTFPHPEELYNGVTVFRKRQKDRGNILEYEMWKIGGVLVEAEGDPFIDEAVGEPEDDKPTCADIFADEMDRQEPEIHEAIPAFANDEIDIGGAVSLGGILTHITPSTPLPKNTATLIFCGGVSKPNPGTGGAGIVVFKRTDNDNWARGEESFMAKTTTTTNEMEHMAILAAVKMAANILQTGDGSIAILTDAQTSLKQVQRTVACKEPRLQTYACRTVAILRDIERRKPKRLAYPLRSRDAWPG